MCSNMYLTHARKRVTLVETKAVEAKIIDGQQRAAPLRPLAERNFLGAVGRTVGILVLLRPNFINLK